MEEKKREHAPEPLADDELENINGGSEIYDNKGRYIGYTGRGTYGDLYVYYTPCPKCGNPMHRGKFGFNYCDPCDYWSMAPNITSFEGTEQDFRRRMKF